VRSRALHVTNGDATVPGLRGTGIAGPILPWRDVLHEGPVSDDATASDPASSSSHTAVTFVQLRSSPL
jgi:hypothetical protein